MEANLGKFIVVDGIDGAGKGGNVVLIEQYLSQKGIHCVSFREPGTTPVGEAIRRILIKLSKCSSFNEIDIYSELLLFYAARNQLIEKRIRPTLSRGIWVICDRFTDSTYAYQETSGVDKKDIEILNTMITKGLKPDLTIILDTDPERALARKSNCKLSLDRIESRGLEYLKKVRQKYLEIAKNNKNDHVVIDSNEMPKEVFELLKIELDSFLKRTNIRPKA